MIDIQVSNIDYAFAMGAKAVAVVSFKVSHSADELPSSANLSSTRLLIERATGTP